jgi:hypothetical protein
MQTRINRAIIYVEGASDKNALTVLLAPLIERKQQAGVSIDIFETPDGDRKFSILTKAPIRAVNILRNDPGAVVVALPDLYPRNKGFPHETFQTLVDGIMHKFDVALQEKGLSDIHLIQSRFKVFCFKHDLEVLLLAAEESLIRQFGNKPLGVSWRKPVEDQNQDHPPKFIVEEIYRQHGQKYRDTIDAPSILRGVLYQDIAERCPQCFKPFIEFLEGLNE